MSDLATRKSRTRGVDLLILIGWILVISVMRAARVEETDPFWQIRAGQEWLDGAALVRADEWSWAPVDGLFYPNSPVWNAALALGWGALNSWGLFAIAAVSIAAYLSITARLAGWLGAGRLPTVLALGGTCLLALPMFSARAGMASQALFMGSLAFAYAWSQRAHRFRLMLNGFVVGVAGFLFSVTGNWIHLSWASLSLGAAVSWALIWILSAPGAPSLRLVLVVGGTVGLIGGILLGPYGLHVFSQAGTVYEACHGLLTEWMGAFDSGTVLRWSGPATAAILIAATSLWWCWRIWRERRLADPRLGLAAAVAAVSLPAALAGVVALRFTGMALLTVAPMTAALTTFLAKRLHRHFLSRDTPGFSRLAEYTSSRFWRVILSATLIVILPFVVLYSWNPAAPTTREANAALPTDCRLFSWPSESAAVILERPDVKVWYDTRADYWGRARIERLLEYVNSPDPAMLVPPGTTCIMLPDPAHSPEVASIVAAIDSDPGWERRTAIDDTIVWVPSTSAG